MTIYEKVDDRGNIVERVQPVPGDFTDTLLGCLVLEGDLAWRIAPVDRPAVEPIEATGGDGRAPGTTSTPTPAGKPRATSHKEQ